MKRMFEVTSIEIETWGKNELIESIKTTEARTIMAETVVSVKSFVGGCSNPETASAFGADMITLNMFNLLEPYIMNFEDPEFEDETTSGTLQTLLADIKSKTKDINIIRRLKKRTGRFIGLNMEPIPNGIKYPEGYKLTKDNLLRVKKLGFDYIVITGNPKTMITMQGIVDGILLAKEVLGDSCLIIAGKMHGAGSGNLYKKEDMVKFAAAGADVVMIGAPLTLPGMTIDVAKEIIEAIHQNGKLALTAIGTSQEGADRAVIEQIALASKQAGSDIIHIGDAGFCGIADPENIKYMSIAIRGKRHTYSRIVNRK